jgi:hypothetical protein
MVAEAVMRIQICFVGAMRGKDDESEMEKDQEKDARYLNVGGSLSHAFSLANQMVVIELVSHEQVRFKGET